jgi:hypothetical protein
MVGWLSDRFIPRCIRVGDRPRRTGSGDLKQIILIAWGVGGLEKRHDAIGYALLSLEKVRVDDRCLPCHRLLPYPEFALLVFPRIAVQSRREVRGDAANPRGVRGHAGTQIFLARSIETDDCFSYLYICSIQSHKSAESIFSSCPCLHTEHRQLDIEK